MRLSFHTLNILENGGYAEAWLAKMEWIALSPHRNPPIRPAAFYKAETDTISTGMVWDENCPFHAAKRIAA